MFRQIQAYLEPGLLRHVMFQTYSAIFTTLNILIHFCPHEDCFGRFRNIQIPGTVRHMLRHIQEPMAYSGIFGTLFRQIQAYLEPQLIREVMFHAYSGIYTKLNISRHICPHSDILQQIQEYSGSWDYRLKVCKPTTAFQVRFFF